MNREWYLILFPVEIVDAEGVHCANLDAHVDGPEHAA
jgi:hypothetical protein